MGELLSVFLQNIFQTLFKKVKSSEKFRYEVSKPFLLFSTLDERDALDLRPRDADENAAEGRLIVAVVVTEVIVGFLFPA